MAKPLKVGIGRDGDDIVKDRKTVIIACGELFTIHMKVGRDAFKHEDDISSIGTLMQDISNDLLTGNYIVEPQ